MRNLTIKREKSFVGCLTKARVFVCDELTGDTKINGDKCYKIGDLKNGEEKTFAIGDEETKIYENDIVEFRELYWTIVWDEALSGFQAQIIMPETDFPLILPLTQIIEGKIVGNKFDNPDLTNKKHSRE